MAINYFIVKDVNNPNKFFVIIKSKYIIAYHSKNSMPLYNAERFIYELENGLIPIIIHPIKKAELPLSKELENQDKIHAYKNKKFDCPCGGHYTNANKNIHFKRLIHLNYLGQQKL